MNSQYNKQLTVVTSQVPQLTTTSQALHQDNNTSRYVPVTHYSEAAYKQQGYTDSFYNCESQDNHKRMKPYRALSDWIRTTVAAPQA